VLLPGPTVLQLVVAVLLVQRDRAAVLVLLLSLFLRLVLVEVLRPAVLTVPGGYRVDLLLRQVL